MNSQSISKVGRKRHFDCVSGRKLENMQCARLQQLKDIYRISFPRYGTTEVGTGQPKQRPPENRVMRPPKRMEKLIFYIDDAHQLADLLSKHSSTSFQLWLHLCWDKLTGDMITNILNVISALY